MEDKHNNIVVRKLLLKRIDNNVSYGEINFKKNKLRKRTKSLLKGISFVLIAVISGGISGVYFTKIRESQTPYKYIYTNQPSQAQDTAHSSSLPKNVVNYVAETVGPAVVGINNNQAAEKTSGLNYESSSSGTIIKSDGYILTNYHTIKDSNNISVKLAGSSTIFKAGIIGYNKRTDLAVIKINMDNLPIVSLGNSSQVKVGDVAVAIGNPLGQDYAGAVTAGVISAVNRKIQLIDADTEEQTTCSVFQTDAAINTSNSGGPLCNEFGELIGVNCLKLDSTGAVSDGIGFAVTVNEVKNVVDSIIKYGYVTSSYFGIKGRTAEVQAEKNIAGVYVSEVISGSGADTAGMRVMDIITEIDGTKINKWEELQALLEKHKTGDNINCKIWRSGKTIDLKVTLSEIKSKK